MQKQRFLASLTAKATAAMLMLAAVSAPESSAKVTLPSVLGSNMVLQQGNDVKLWGTADPDSKLKVTGSWSSKKYQTTVGADGKWMIEIPAPEAGGPYEITISDGEPLTLTNVMVGEVWFCSGQSNMEMPMGGFDRQPLHGGNDVIARAKASTPIRMFICDSKDGRWVRQQSKTPQEDCQGEWLTNTPVNVSHCSAAAYYFARYLQEVLDVPVGVIVSSLGGSKIEPWISREAISQFKDYDLSSLDDTATPVKSAHNDPCVLYNAKVAPFTKFPVKGFLWYQGESNRNNAEIYDRLMAAMVKDWRTRWGGGEKMPFYFVEIAPYDYEGPDGISAAKLREAQMKAMKEIPNCGMASTIDIGNHNFIHPVNKEAVGQRLAWWALGQTYGLEGFGYATPYYDSMEIKDGKIYINAKNVGNGMCPMWTSLTGFEIAGDDHVFHPAFAEIETKSCRLAVSSKDVPNPVAVRYCYKNTPQPSVYNIQGLPLLPFRTDNWE